MPAAAMAAGKSIPDLTGGGWLTAAVPDAAGLGACLRAESRLFAMLIAVPEWPGRLIRPPAHHNASVQRVSSGPRFKLWRAAPQRLIRKSGSTRRSPGTTDRGP